MKNSRNIITDRRVRMNDMGILGEEDRAAAESADRTGRILAGDAARGKLRSVDMSAARRWQRRTARPTLNVNPQANSHREQTNADPLRDRPACAEPPRLIAADHFEPAARHRMNG